MSAEEIKELRKETKKYIDHADERVLKMIHAMLEADEEKETAASCYLTPEQEAILDERIREYENGQMKFSSWEDARARITAKKKNAA